MKVGSEQTKTVRATIECVLTINPDGSLGYKLSDGKDKTSGEYWAGEWLEEDERRFEKEYGERPKLVIRDTNFRDKHRQAIISYFSLLLPSVLHAAAISLLLEADEFAEKAIAGKRPDIDWSLKNIAHEERRRRHNRLGITRGASKGSKKPKVIWGKDGFYKALTRYVRDYESLEGKPPTAPEAARKLKFGSARTMNRRRKDWGDGRRWMKLMDDILTG